MLEQIETYVRRGWAVFPCNGKVPLTAHGYKDASKDIAGIKGMWRDGANVAIATGEVSGIFVVDIDIKNDAGGDESLRELEQLHGELPRTVESITCSGGRHIFFKYPEKGIKCGAGIRPGIDIRGDGGYVIAPPSVIDGKKYEWEAAHMPEDTPIVNAPEWLLALLKERAIAPPGNEGQITKNRNDTLMRIGVKLRKAGLDYPQIESSLQDINIKRCVPSLERKEVSRIARSVARYEVNRSDEPLTDVWNAKMFVENYGEDIRFCDALGGWFVWDGLRWKRDDDFRVLHLAKEAIRQVREMAISKNDNTLFKHSVKSESEHRLRAMINLAKSEGITVGSDQFDKDIFLLNCLNGTLDLQTGKLRPHERKDYITRCMEWAYRPEAECLQWQKFLADIFLNDAELLGFMQKAVGYTLSGSIKEQCIFMLYGTGMNGKSTFLKHLYRVFGDYAMNTPASTLVEKYNDAIPNDIARLKGARLVTAVESGKNKALAESQVKQLTGDDVISARFLHHEYFDFFATFKIFFATNYKPNISGTDRGIWRRIRTVPFEKVITSEERDVFLDEKLQREYEGILAWAVAGFSLWQEKGLGEAARIVQATNEYREESDLIGNFIKEQCVVGKGYQVSATVILKSLQQWTRDNSSRFVRRNEFIDYMKREGFIRSRLSSSADKGKIYWTGIGLKDDEPGNWPRSTGSEVLGEISQKQNFTTLQNFTLYGDSTDDSRPF